MGDLRPASLSRIKGNNFAFKEDKETTQTVPWMSYDRENKNIKNLLKNKSVNSHCVVRIP